MGPASGTLRGTGRRGGMAGVLVLLALSLGGALPAAAGNGHGNKDHGAQEQPQAAPQSQGAGKPSKDRKPPKDRAGTQAAAAEPVPAAEGPAAPTAAPKGKKRGISGADKPGRRGSVRDAHPVVVQPPVATPTVTPVPALTVTRVPVAGNRPAARRQAARRPAAARRSRRGRSAPQRPPMAADRWVPAAPAVVAEPIAPAPARTAQPRRTAKVERDLPGDVLHIVPVVLNALSGSVAFVPDAVWGAIGALVLVMLALFGLAIARDRKARALGREREVLIADLRALEGAVLPALPETLGGLALSITSSPATRPATGGDFHDAFALSQDRVAVLVGDVAGDGRTVPADAQLVRHAVRAYLEAGLDPRSAIAMTGAVVDDRYEPLFATVVVAVHDRRAGTLTFASAGHEPPVFVTGQGAGLAPVSGWSPPLGAGLETGRRQTTIPVSEGSAVCLLTDGVTEARSEGERVGVSRVIKWLSTLGPGALSSDVVARLEAEAQTSDDVTVCMLRVLTPADPDAPRIEEAVVEGGDPTYLIRFLCGCGLPLADAEEAGAALAAAPDGTRMVASVEIRGGRAVVELAPLRGATTELVI